MRIFVLLISIFFSANLFAQNPVVSKAKLVSEAYHVKDNSELFFALKFSLPEDYYSYWLNPGEVGMVTEVIWEKDENIQIGEFIWPVPSKLVENGLSSFIYEDDFALILPVTIKQLEIGREYKIRGVVNWLICKDVCIPFTQKVETKIKAGKDLIIAEDFGAYKAKIPVTESGDIEYNFDQSNIWFKLPKKNFYFHNKYISFFPEEHNIIAYKEAVEIREEGNNYYLVAALYDLPKIDNFAALIQEDINFWRISAVLNSNLELPNATIPFSFKAFLPQLLFAFLGGLILNLMPCVFPVLSLKALHIAKSSDVRKSSVRIESLSYSLGVILSFVMLSLLIIFLKYIGYEVGWGFQMQSPIFVAILALLFFIIGLNLVGFFEVKNSLANVGAKLTRGNSTLSSFFTGFLATVVATPCTAPFMATALGFALAHDISVVVTTFVFLGLGLSAPILIFTFFPNTVRFLPKPGQWLENFKQFLAFPIFLTVVWLLFVLSSLTEFFNILWLQVLLIYLAFVIWLFFRIKRGFVIKILALLALFYFFSDFYTAIDTDVKASSGSLQRLSTDKKIELIADYRNKGQKMLINVTADWCITCKVNEQVAIKPLLSNDFFQDNNIKYISLDWTKANSDITKFLNNFERNGVPLYVYFDMHGTAHLLPQILTPKIIKQKLLD